MAERAAILAMPFGKGTSFFLMKPESYEEAGKLLDGPQLSNYHQEEGFFASRRTDSRDPPELLPSGQGKEELLQAVKPIDS